MKMWMLSMMSQPMLMKNHMKMLMITIVASLILSMKMFMNSLNYWNSVLLMLIYVSGVMVLFMFVVSLSPNESWLMKNQKSFSGFLLVNSLLFSTTKNTMNSNESFHMNSSYLMNITLMLMVLMIVLMSAYAPPKMMNTANKGMKSSK